VQYKLEEARRLELETMQLFQLLAPCLVICAISFCPKSPRWLVKKDRMELAVKALSKVRHDAEMVQL